MPAPLVGGAVKLLGVDVTKQIQGLPLVGGLFSAKSPRYGGGDGPLYSTVNGFMAQVASGDLAVINKLNGLRKSDADKKQWQLFWDTDMLSAVATEAQRSLIIKLDPTKAGRFPTGMPAAPTLTPAPKVTPGGLGFGTPTTSPMGASGQVQETADKIGAAVGLSRETVLLVAALVAAALVVRAVRS